MLYFLLMTKFYMYIYIRTMSKSHWIHCYVPCSCYARSRHTPHTLRYIPTVAMVTCPDTNMQLSLRKIIFVIKRPCIQIILFTNIFKDLHALPSLRSRCMKTFCSFYLFNLFSLFSCTFNICPQSFHIKECLSFFLIIIIISKFVKRVSLLKVT